MEKEEPELVLGDLVAYNYLINLGLPSSFGMIIEVKNDYIRTYRVFWLGSKCSKYFYSGNEICQAFLS